MVTNEGYFVRKLRAADLFCGAGGTTEGAESSGAVQVEFALNHWQTAVDTHSANFPNAKHVNSRLEDTSPSECRAIDLLFASPECTHHARARGGKPTSDQQRSGAWSVLPWVEHHRPSWLVIENVVEFREWGPVGKDGRPLKSGKGKFFDAWLMAIRGAGYRLDDRDLNAADFGARTSRNRLFIIGRKGNRSPIFPEPTHSRRPGGELPGLSLPPWRPASDVIDWSIPCPSIFARKRPLADNTLIRLEAGLRRFVGPYISRVAHGEGRWGHGTHSLDESLPTLTTSKDFALSIPFTVQFDNTGSNCKYVRPLNDPMHTFTTKANTAIAAPFLLDVNHAGLDHRGHSINKSLGTIQTHNGKGLAMPFVLSTGSGGSPRGTDRPIPTIVAKDGTAFALPWLSHYYGTDNQSPVTDPLDTITAKERHSMCIALCRGPQDWPSPQTEAMLKLQATMKELGVADLLFRMLQNAELSAAQGFRPEYLFTGSKADVTRQIGNSVSPPVAREICTAIAG